MEFFMVDVRSSLGPWGFAQFFSHLGSYKVSVALGCLLLVGEARVADRKHPKEWSHPKADHGQDAKAGNAVEYGVQDESAPFLANEKIQGRNEDDCKVDH